MNRKAITNGLTAAVPLWGILLGLLLDNAALLILGLFALLLLLWATHPFRWARDQEYEFDRDKERLGFTHNENAPARGLDARGRTTRR